MRVKRVKCVDSGCRVSAQLCVKCVCVVFVRMPVAELKPVAELPTPNTDPRYCWSRPADPKTGGQGCAAGRFFSTGWPAGHSNQQASGRDDGPGPLLRGTGRRHGSCLVLALYLV